MGLTTSLVRWFGADQEINDREALAVVNRSLEDKRPQHKFALSALARSIDTKVEAGKRPPLPRISFKHHFRLVQILAPFLLVGDTVSMVTPGTPFSKSRRLQALPSLRLCPHSSLGSRHAA